MAKEDEKYSIKREVHWPKRGWTREEEEAASLTSKRAKAVAARGLELLPEEGTPKTNKRANHIKGRGC